MAKLPRPERATIIISAGLTSPAETAACPIIKAPMIPMVFPITPGTRMPPSLISSKENSIKIISKMVGKGTVVREAIILNNKAVGIISW